MGISSETTASRALYQGGVSHRPYKGSCPVCPVLQSVMPRTATEKTASDDGDDEGEAPALAVEARGVGRAGGRRECIWLSFIEASLRQRRTIQHRFLWIFFASSRPERTEMDRENYRASCENDQFRHRDHGGAGVGRACSMRARERGKFVCLGRPDGRQTGISRGVCRLAGRAAGRSVAAVGRAPSHPRTIMNAHAALRLQHSGVLRNNKLVSSPSPCFAQLASAVISETRICDLIVCKNRASGRICGETGPIHRLHQAPNIGQHQGSLALLPLHQERRTPPRFHYLDARRSTFDHRPSSSRRHRLPGWPVCCPPAQRDIIDSVGHRPRIPPSTPPFNCITTTMRPRLPTSQIAVGLPSL